LKSDEAALISTAALMKPSLAAPGSSLSILALRKTASLEVASLMASGF
jgi:hypothetical protein